MGLPLDIVRTTGRSEREVRARVVRELAAGDLALLAEEKGSRPAPVVRLRERHHALARLLAEGRKPGEAAVICGYDLSRVSILQGDPTFQDLVKLYRDDVNQRYGDMHTVLAGLSLDGALVLRERLEEAPEKIKTADILEIVKLGADRTGHGPTATQQVNVNVNLADRLQEARKRLAARTIDVTPDE